MNKKYINNTFKREQKEKGNIYIQEILLYILGINIIYSVKNIYIWIQNFSFKHFQNLLLVFY